MQLTEREYEEELDRLHLKILSLERIKHLYEGRHTAALKLLHQMEQAPMGTPSQWYKGMTLKALRKFK